jgi:hypothetical protein
MLALGFTTLLREILLAIFGMLNGQSISSTLRTCKQLNQLLDGNLVASIF